ncbi:MAG: hypothetical protein HY096_14570 [Nitrospinae bacterium]|nr:hypothetical protein [Nitrospinota bacterium]
MIKKYLLPMVVSIFFITSSVWAGGWDANKGLSKITLTGDLLCVGCSLKKLDGANAQCDLYAHHAIGFKTADGTLWSIVDNAKGHDVIRSHELLEKKKATITGYLYPIANFIEIDDIQVEGVTTEQIQKAGYEEDMLLAKRLMTRKVGEVPALSHDHKNIKNPCTAKNPFAIGGQTH